MSCSQSCGHVNYKFDSSRSFTQLLDEGLRQYELICVSDGVFVDQDELSALGFLHLSPWQILLIELYTVIGPRDATIVDHCIYMH